MLAKLCLKILQTRLQQYVNWELPDGQVGFRKGRGTKNQIANILWIIEKTREFQKNINLVDHNKVMWITSNWKILKEMGMPDHLTCHLRNLYVGQEATVRTRHGITDCFQTGKEIWQGYILSYCFFKFYVRVNHMKCQAEWSTSWKQDCREQYQQPQICRWYHSNGRKWRGLTSLLMRGKEESEKAGLKLSIQTAKIMASNFITSWLIEGEKWKQWHILFSCF